MFTFISQDKRKNHSPLHDMLYGTADIQTAGSNPRGQRIPLLCRQHHRDPEKHGGQQPRRYMLQSVI